MILFVLKNVKYIEGKILYRIFGVMFVYYIYVLYLFVIEDVICIFFFIGLIKLN